MKIALVSFEFPPDTAKGGIGTYTYELAKLLASDELEVHIFAASPIRSGSLIQDGYHLHLIQTMSPVNFQEDVVRVFANIHSKVKFDLVESPEINANGLLIKKAFPELPMVVRLHAPNHLVESLKKYYRSWYIKARITLGALRRGMKVNKYDPKNDPDYSFCQTANYLSAPSTAMRNWVTTNWAIPAERIQVIANPFYPDPRWLGIGPSAKEEVCIMFFGRLNVLKGLVVFTLAMKKILRRHANVRLLIIGADAHGPKNNPSMKGWMQKKLNPFRNRITWKTEYDRDELTDFFQEAQIVVLPSLFESFSYTCVESMSAGKAIIGSKNGAMIDLLEHGKNGFLINPSSVGELVQCTEELISNSNLRLALGKEARNTILKKFEVTEQRNQWFAYYKSLVHEPR